MVINSPDSIGLACNFDPHGFTVKPGKTNYGLPNIPDYRMQPLVDQVAACGPDILLCKNDSVRLGVPDTSGTLTFQWWPSAGLSDPGAAQPWASPLVSTTYHLMVVDTTVQSSCDNTIDSVRVEIVSPLLTRPVAFAGNDTVVCAGVALQLGMADTTGGAWGYAWSSAVGGLDDPFVSNPMLTPSLSAQYILRAYRPEVVGSCQTDRDTVVVTVYDPSVLPQYPAGPDRVICVGDTVLLGLGAWGLGLEYDWSPGVGLGDAQSATPLAWPAVTTAYLLAVQDSFFAGACAGVRDTVNITVEEQNLQNLQNPQDVEFCVGECFVLGVPGVSGLAYAWSPVEGLYDPSAAMTRAQPAATTVYTLTVIDPALQSLNCRERRFVVHAVADACNRQSFIAVNGDGIAEVLDLGDHAGRVALRVFDVAGRLVFGDEDYHNIWSATNLARGIYLYRVTVEGDCPSSFTGKIAVFH